LVLREARETVPSLEAEANGILNTTTNLEDDPGYSPMVGFGFWLVPIVPRVPSMNWFVIDLSEPYKRAPPPEGPARSYKPP
jgi:hypothetical protein